MSYCAQRFEAAVNILVREGPIKQRLAHAYSDQLEELVDHELPAELREAFGSLHAALHRVPPIGIESRVKASVQKMSSAEAVAHARTILSIYANLLAHPVAVEPLKVVEASDTDAPWYLVNGS